MKNKEKKNGKSNTHVAALRRSPRFSSSDNSLRRATRLSCARGDTPAPNTALELPKIKRKRSQFKKNISSKSIPGAYQLRDMDEVARAARFRYYLKRRIARFKNLFVYGPEEEERTCILASGETFYWKENSSGTTWVAIHGSTPYCVVSMDSWPERDPPIHGDKYRPPSSLIVRTVLDQISDTSSALRERVANYSHTGPFAVVSVAPGTVEDHQETSHKAYSHAINFLKSKLKDRADLPCGEIVKIGVWALKCLFGSKFQSNQIEIYFYDGVGWDGKYGLLRSSEVDGVLNDFNEMAAGDDHLAAAATINETTNSDHLAATSNETSIHQ